MKMDDTGQVIKAEQDLAKAHLTMDLAAIDALLHKDYKILQPGGVIETKNDVLGSYLTGNRYWNKAEVSSLVVDFFGETARVTGLWSAAGNNNGEIFDYQARFLSIWTREEGHWQNIAYASAELDG